MPLHLRDSHYAGAEGLGHGEAYSYPHDEESGVSEQEYLPDALRGREYYRPSNHGRERALGERLSGIKEQLSR